MAKQRIRSPAGQIGRAIGQGAWRTLIFCALAVVLLLVFWFYLYGILPFWAGTGRLVAALFAGHVVLSLALERILSGASVGFAWRYRLAFLISAGAPLFLLVFLLLFPGKAYAALPRPPVLAASLLSAGMGAFAGGLLATALNQGLWEENAPPQERILAEVRRWHLEIMDRPAVEPVLRQVVNRALALAGLLFSAPVALLCAFLIWLEDPGPIIFTKNSVGIGGVNFHQFKFRTMVRDAENYTGPILAGENDPRTLLSGRFLRKTALDELPQLINILRGEMNFVGPRPQRTILVHGYLQKIPEYACRHAVRPGLSGLAQVAGSYYLTPRQKLRFDRLYIRYATLGFDLKLLGLACLITFWYRWQKGWQGKLPRRLLHGRSATLRRQPDAP